MPHRNHALLSPSCPIPTSLQMREKHTTNRLNTISTKQIMALYITNMHIFTKKIAYIQKHSNTLHNYLHRCIMTLNFEIQL